MALQLTDNSADNINHGSDASIDNFTTYTILAWIKFTSTNTFRNVFNKSSANGWFSFLADPATRLTVGANRSGDNVGYTTDSGSITIGAWNFVAVTFDEAASPRIHIYIGDLTTEPTEPGYAVSNDGTGTLDADAGSDLIVGGAAGVAAADHATFAYINSVLSLNQTIFQWMRPHVIDGCKLFTHYGFNGTGSQPDWSGNGNNGTTAGTVVVDHVPLGPPFGWDTGEIFTPAPPIRIPRIPATYNTLQIY